MRVGRLATVESDRLASDGEQIRALVHDYALAMDNADTAAFSDLFVADGSLVVWALGRDEPLGVFRGPGPDGVGMIARMLGDLYAATLHHITTHRATIDGDAATGTTYCLAYHVLAGDEGDVLETIGVRYEEAFVRTAAGWRMRERNATRLWAQTTPAPARALAVDRAAGAARREQRSASVD
jgi:hypothetical protein